MIYRIMPKGKAFEVTVEDESGVVAVKQAKDQKEALAHQKSAVKDGHADWDAPK